MPSLVSVCGGGGHAYVCYCCSPLYRVHSSSSSPCAPCCICVSCVWCEHPGMHSPLTMLAALTHCHQQLMCDGLPQSCLCNQSVSACDLSWRVSLRRTMIFSPGCLPSKGRTTCLHRICFHTISVVGPLSR